MDFQDGRGYYELNRLRDHHHHLVCLKCGEAQKIGNCPFELMSASMPDGFKAVSHRFEIYGYCRDCQE